MNQNIRIPEGELWASIDGIIANATARKAALVEQDRAKGVVLTDNPVALMLMRPEVVALGEAAGEYQEQEDVDILSSLGPLPSWPLVRCRFVRGQGAYMTARNSWDAYVPVRDLLVANGWTQGEIYRVITRLFPTQHVYGVLSVVFHEFPDGYRVLMGVRSAKLAGKNKGDASFPGGLVHPGETLAQAADRQLSEEGGCGTVVPMPGFAFDVHNAAPSMTFVRGVMIDSTEVKDSFEWTEKMMIWVPRRAARAAVDGDSRDLVAAFRARGIEVPDELKVAPDAAGPARTILDAFSF
jgi:ADP-ribose pyrophosphatase YjhB (NUDIX family)